MRAAQITRITVGATIRIPSYGVRQPVLIGSGDFSRPPTPPQTEPDPFFRLFSREVIKKQFDD